MNSSLRMIAAQCDADSHRWFPNTADDVFFIVACMTGEAGEALNEAKKVARGSVPLEEAREKILEECADTLVYCMNVFGMLDADPEWWYQRVREKNLARFEKKRPMSTLGDRGIGRQYQMGFENYPIGRPIKDNPQA